MQPTALRLALLTPLVACFASHAVGQDSPPASETWSVIQIGGAESGWARETKEALPDGGFRVSSEGKLEINRQGQIMKVSVDRWSVEDAEGRLREMHQRMTLSGMATEHALVVKGDEAELTTTTLGKPRVKAIEWDGAVIGPAAVGRLRRQHGMQPGASFSYTSFSLDSGKPFTMTVTFQEPNETELLDGARKTLSYSLGESDLTSSARTQTWYDPGGKVVKTAFKTMGMEMVSLSATQERAQNGPREAIKPDLLLKSAAPSNVALPTPYRLDSVTYRLVAKDKELGIPKGLGDVRQTVVEQAADHLVLKIQAKVPTQAQARPLADPAPELAEYLAPNPMIQSDHEGLRQKVAELVGDEPDAWKAATTLERFVYDYIADKNYGTGFASAGEVFENPTGDCTEHAVLLAAFCRAAGIPARVAVGYMYLGGVFAGHMWAEVWIQGEWHALDGVMGIGRVDPTHIRFSTSSLADGGIGGAFVEAMQGLGNLELEVLEFSRGDTTVQVDADFKDYSIKANTYTNTLLGVKLRKPQRGTFGGYERDASKIEFTLVTVEHEGTSIELRSTPASFRFTWDALREGVARGKPIRSEEATRVNGRPARLFELDADGKTRRVLAVLDQDTCFVLDGTAEGKQAMKTLDRVFRSFRFVDTTTRAASAPR